MINAIPLHFAADAGHTTEAFEEMEVPGPLEATVPGYRQHLRFEFRGIVGALNLSKWKTVAAIEFLCKSLATAMKTFHKLSWFCTSACTTSAFKASPWAPGPG